MTRDEREKAISVLKNSTPIMGMNFNEINDYIKTINNLINWLEQQSCDDCICRREVE